MKLCALVMISHHASVWPLFLISLIFSLSLHKKNNFKEETSTVFDAFKLSVPRWFRESPVSNGNDSWPISSILGQFPLSYLSLTRLTVSREESKATAKYHGRYILWPPQPLQWWAPPSFFCLLCASSPLMSRTQTGGQNTMEAVIPVFISLCNPLPLVIETCVLSCFLPYLLVLSSQQSVAKVMGGCS